MLIVERLEHPMKNTAILLVSCPDRKGIVAAIADFIFQHGGNILHADEHADEGSDLFLMRVEFDPSEFDIDLADFAKHFSPIAGKFGMKWRLARSTYRPKMVILVSKHDHCLVDLLYRHKSGHDLRQPKTPEWLQRQTSGETFTAPSKSEWYSRAWPTLLEHVWRDAAADLLLAHSMECVTERGTPPNRTIVPHGRKHSGAGWVAALRDQPPPGESTPTGRGRSTARRVCRSGLPALSAMATSPAHLARPDRQARRLLAPVSPREALKPLMLQ